MPALFGDDMVLQAGTGTPVYGKATPGAVVRVRLGDHVASAQADANGNWRAGLDLPRQEGPLQLDVTCGGAAAHYGNVMVGEVWICSGQSNMEWSYHDAKAAGQPALVAAANQPQLRLFKVRHVVSSIPLQEPQGHWVQCTADDMNDFSLLGYLFGTSLRQHLGGTVGLIESDWGGTPAESWTPRETLEAAPQLRNLVDSTDPVPSGAGPAAGVKHKPEQAASVLYNGMIHPLLDFGFRGVAWYQGESNVGRAGQYRVLFPAMVEAWRQRAGRVFPFVFVQLANFGDRGDEAGSEWARLREAQADALSLPKTGMATAIDLAHPDNIHWIRRDELAKRLAWVALDVAYDRNLPACGPVYQTSRIDGNQVRVEFASKLNGLVFRSADGLSGFEVAGEDRVFHRALGRIYDGAVIVYSPEVPHPVAVRYAWADNPEASLYNSAGLPARPFRTDDWEDSPRAPN